MSQPIVIFVSHLAESLNMDENVCSHKLQEALFNKYGKKWSSGGSEIINLQHKGNLVLYVDKNVTYSSKEYYENWCSDDYNSYTPWFVNNEFKFPIFEEQSEGYSENTAENITEPTKGYTILPAKIALPAGEYTKKDLLGFIKML